jgi:hypothetical protein
MTQSWIVAARKAVLKAFRGAGAAIIEHPRRFSHELIVAVIPGHTSPRN